MSPKDWEAIAADLEAQLGQAKAETREAKDEALKNQRKVAELRAIRDEALGKLGEDLALAQEEAAQNRKGLEEMKALLVQVNDDLAQKRADLATIRRLYAQNPVEPRSTDGRGAQVQPARISNVSYYHLRDRMKSMTEAQWKDYARSIRGQRVQWSGWVEDVNEKFLGGYELWIDMDPPGQLSVSDVEFDIPADVALRLKKDQEVVFRGTIRSALDTLGVCSVHLADAEVIR